MARASGEAGAVGGAEALQHDHHHIGAGGDVAHRVGGRIEPVRHGPEQIGLHRRHVRAFLHCWLAQGHQQGERCVQHHGHLRGRSVAGRVDHLQGDQLKATARSDHEGGDGDAGARQSSPGAQGPSVVEAGGPSMTPGQQRQQCQVDQHDVPVVAGEGRGQVGGVAARCEDPQEVRRAALEAELVVLQVDAGKEEGHGVDAEVEAGQHAAPGVRRTRHRQAAQHPHGVQPGQRAEVEAQSAPIGRGRRIGERPGIEKDEEDAQQGVHPEQQPGAHRQHQQGTAQHRAKVTGRREPGERRRRGYLWAAGPPGRPPHRCIP